MTEEFDWKRIFFMESNWCCSCEHRWRYITQEPCSKCFFGSVGPNEPAYYKKETVDA